MAVFKEVALEHNVLEAQVLAELCLGRRIAVFVDDEELRGNALQLIGKIHNIGATADSAPFHMPKGFEHVFALHFGIHRRAAFQLLNSAVRPGGHEDISVKCCFFQKADVTAVQHVETTADEDLFRDAPGDSAEGLICELACTPIDPAQLFATEDCVLTKESNCLNKDCFADSASV